jgi:transposase
MENLTTLINDLITKFGLRPEDIASRTGASLMTIYRWRTGSFKKAHRASIAAVERLHRYEEKKHGSGSSAK